MNAWIIHKRSNPEKKKWKIVYRDAGWKEPKWITFKGSERDAEKERIRIIAAAERGDFVQPSKRTFGEWLPEWLEKSVKPAQSPRTYVVYEIVVRRHLLKSALAGIRLQALKPSDVAAYYHSRIGELSIATRRLHHAVIRAALNAALDDGLVQRNVALRALKRSKKERSSVPQQKPQAWTAEEARSVLAAAKADSTQAAAFIAIALDSGARKGELQGLCWSHVDLTTGALRIERQLVKSGREPVFGPTKTGASRSLDLSKETLVLMREHKREQAELKLANRPRYAEHDLVFAQAWEQRGRDVWQLGAPLSAGCIARMLDRLIRSAKVRRISVHGLRHTSATLLLAAGVQPHVVQKRLGHSSVVVTLGIYAHVLPSQQQDATAKLAMLLHG